MTKTQRRADEVIDAFVARVNGSPRELLLYNEVPEALRDGPAQRDGWDLPWAIRPAPPPCLWIDAFEAKLPGRLPRSYRSLVTRYLFPAFDVGPVQLFACTGGAVEDAWELARAVFHERHLCTPLLAAGFVQFGRRAGGSYDPICFDFNRRSNDGECPVVQLDHEAALVGDRAQVVAELADSFLALVGS
jgi:hypothetical protein